MPASPIGGPYNVDDKENEGMSIVALFMFMVFLVLGVGGTILWIWMIVDCATKEKSEGNDKLIWILVIVLTHWIGALIYLLVRRPKRIQQYGA
jgi:nitrate reductase gamma subunit